MSNSHVTSAVPESIEWGVDPTVQFLAEAGKGSTAQGKDIAWGQDTGQWVAGTEDVEHLNLRELKLKIGTVSYSNQGCRNHYSYTAI